LGLSGLILSSLAALISFLAVWMITSLAVFAAGRMIVGRYATFPKASALILVGAILLGVTYVAASFLFTPFFGWIAAFLLWLGLIKYFFGTGWIGAFMISILACIILMLLAVGLTLALAVIGVHVPYMPETPEELLPTV